MAPKEKIILTRAEIEDQLELAALTLKRLPGGAGPRGFGSSWPDYVRSRFTAYGTEPSRVRVVPSAREIQHMEDTIEWLMLIGGKPGEEQRTAEDRKIVWLKAEGQNWRVICSRVGLSRSQANRRWVAALITIEKRLAAGPRAQSGKGNRPKASTLNGEGGRARSADLKRGRGASA